VAPCGLSFSRITRVFVSASCGCAAVEQQVPPLGLKPSVGMTNHERSALAARLEAVLTRGVCCVGRDYDCVALRALTLADAPSIRMLMGYYIEHV